MESKSSKISILFFSGQGKLELSFLKLYPGFIRITQTRLIAVSPAFLSHLYETPLWFMVFSGTFGISENGKFFEFLSIKHIHFILLLGRYQVFILELLLL